MPVTSAVIAPYNGIGNQTQIAKTIHSIPDADPSMLSNTRTNIVRRTKYTTPALEKLSELPFISIVIRLLFSLSPSDFLIPYDFHLYLASELNRGRNRSPRPVTNFTGRHT